MSVSPNNIQDSASRDSLPPSDSLPTPVASVTDTELLDMREALAEDVFGIMDEMVIPPELHWAVITYMRGMKTYPKASRLTQILAKSTV
ncbi:hypothetical protein HYFRA_00006641 [Hymenoscyphus fraxineus]|uniref:Uncharacterized protein n=1 Tax=Hymenoscyphus fraxineus TaxID=746836 RepID=A0A9N9PNN7_9HELO|nr:hypothetical protein HYFRA_00006641 [Hymenoscyphus fraxineus]